jgi:hypothetical protein
MAKGPKGNGGKSGGGPKVSKARLVAKVGAGGAATVAKKLKQQGQKQQGRSPATRPVQQKSGGNTPKINLGYKKVGNKVIPTAKTPTLNLGYKKVGGKVRLA